VRATGLSAFALRADPPAYIDPSAYSGRIIFQPDRGHRMLSPLPILPSLFDQRIETARSSLPPTPREAGSRLGSEPPPIARVDFPHRFKSSSDSSFSIPGDFMGDLDQCMSSRKCVMNSIRLCNYGLTRDVKQVYSAIDHSITQFLPPLRLQLVRRGQSVGLIDPSAKPLSSGSPLSHLRLRNTGLAENAGVVPCLKTSTESFRQTSF
jgi:hypothetical protein